jgi:hypothetical protein
MSQHDSRVARQLKQTTDRIGPAADTPEARARTVEAMRAAMRTPLPRRAARWPLGLALAASVALVTGAVWMLRPPPLARVGESTFERGARIEATSQPLVVELRGNVRLTLSRGAAVQLTGPTEVRIERGEVAADVLARDTTFTLDCVDSVVTTRGVQLTVAHGAGCDGRARVAVTAGEAALPDGTVLRADARWPRCPEAVVPALVEPAPVVEPPPLPAPKPVVRPTPIKPKPGVAVAPPAPPTSPREEALARQNALYLEAVALQRSGALEPALQKLELLLAEKDAPLLETLLAQKMRWLATTRRAEARAVANDYLHRFPMGFARAEAELLVLEKP